MKQSIINWISPKDKLPGNESTPEKEVIICFNRPKDKEPVTTAVFFRGKFVWDNYTEIEDEILYWAELPEPPKPAPIPIKVPNDSPEDILKDGYVYIYDENGNPVDREFSTYREMCDFVDEIFEKEQKLNQLNTEK